MAITNPKTQQAAPRKAQRPKITPEQRAKLAGVADQRLVMRLTTAQVDMARDRQLLDAEIKKLTRDKEAIDATFQQQMEDVGALVAVDRRGNPIVELAANPSERIDTKRLKAERPDVAAEFTHTVGTDLKPKYLIKL